jgi:hypothetical protein
MAENHLTTYQQTLTPHDVTALCAAARKAWDQAGPRTRLVRFTWRRKRFVSTWTTFRMLVKTASGEPVACRYH